MHSLDRALVLGAGGLVGTAWTAGLACGLRRGGVDLGEADLIVGTSAGAITAALLATGQDLDRLATPVRPADSGSTPPQVDGRRLGEAFAVLGMAASDPAEARRRVGRIALAAETGPEQAHVARIRAMVGADQWPDRQLLIAAMNAGTGEQEVFDREWRTAALRRGGKHGLPGHLPTDHHQGPPVHGRLPAVGDQRRTRSRSPHARRDRPAGARSPGHAQW
nr:patatin-like phospholipase family protein [Streptomyces sp. NRRL B-3648]